MPLPHLSCWLNRCYHLCWGDLGCGLICHCCSVPCGLGSHCIKGPESHVLPLLLLPGSLGVQVPPLLATLGSQVSLPCWQARVPGATTIPRAFGLGCCHIFWSLKLQGSPLLLGKVGNEEVGVLGTVAVPVSSSLRHCCSSDHWLCHCCFSIALPP